MMVSCPRKPSSRNASAARSPVSEAPTMTMRPLFLKPSPFIGAGPLFAVESVHDDRLHRALRRCPQHPQTLTVVRVGVVVKSPVAAELEHVGCEPYALRIPQAAVQVDDDPH